MLAPLPRPLLRFAEVSTTGFHKVDPNKPSPSPALTHARNTHAIEPVIVLRALLANGPRCSREVLAEMAARGISAKQVRTAREKQRIAMHRTGSGKGMRTTWALLPGGDIHAHADRTCTRPREGKKADAMCQQLSTSELAEAAVPRAAGPQQISTAADAADAAADPSKPDLQRRDARIHALRARGIPAAEAGTVADALLIADRRNVLALGSCAQCQWWGSNDCSAIRPATEVHVCWGRRTVVA